MRQKPLRAQSLDVAQVHPRVGLKDAAGSLWSVFTQREGAGHDGIALVLGLQTARDQRRGQGFVDVRMTLPQATDLHIRIVADRAQNQRQRLVCQRVRSWGSGRP